METKKQTKSLLQWAYSDKTVSKYERAVDGFVDWCESNGLDYSDDDDLDDLAADYLEFMFESGKGKASGFALVNGLVMKMPRLKDKLLVCKKSMVGWNRAMPSVSYPPMTFHLTVALAVKLAQLFDVRLAIGVLTAFDGLLRLGELLSLRKEDVSLPQDVRLGSVKDVTLSLGKTKTGKNQFVVLQREEVKELVAKVVRLTDKSCYLFPFSASYFRKCFKVGVQELGLSQDYVPHSLRHGAATEMNLAGKSIEDVLLAGRWASNKSARVYIQSGRSLMMKMVVPKAVAEAGEKIVRLGGIGYALAKVVTANKRKTRNASTTDKKTY